MRHILQSPAPRIACETERKLGLRQFACLLALAACLVAAPAGPVRAAQAEPAAAGEAAHEEGGRGAIDVVARIVNFAILAGALVYLLRSPLATYLKDRSTQIRSELVNAEEMKKSAAAAMLDIDRKMAALPGELEALRTQGAREIAAEEERIHLAAATERERLLEQARRQIDLQVRSAERDLVNHAAELAVSIAGERIKKNITDDDQKRLVDRYVSQLKS